MKKIKKRYNLKIISLLLAALFLLNTTAYGIGPSNKVRLRVPITGNNQQFRGRLEEAAVLASNGALNQKDEAGYSKSRRKFLLKTGTVAAGLFMVPLPVLSASIESGPRIDKQIPEKFLNAISIFDEKTREIILAKPRIEQLMSGGKFTAFKRYIVSTLSYLDDPEKQKSILNNIDLMYWIESEARDFISITAESIFDMEIVNEELQISDDMIDIWRGLLGDDLTQKNFFKLLINNERAVSLFPDVIKLPLDKLKFINKTMGGIDKLQGNLTKRGPLVKFITGIQDGYRMEPWLWAKDVVSLANKLDLPVFEKVFPSIYKYASICRSMFVILDIVPLNGDTIKNYVEHIQRLDSIKIKENDKQKERIIGVFQGALYLFEESYRNRLIRPDIANELLMDLFERQGIDGYEGWLQDKLAPELRNNLTRWGMKPLNGLNSWQDVSWHDVMIRSIVGVTFEDTDYVPSSVEIGIINNILDDQGIDRNDPYEFLKGLAYAMNMKTWDKDILSTVDKYFIKRHDFYKTNPWAETRFDPEFFLGGRPTISGSLFDLKDALSYYHGYLILPNVKLPIDPEERNPSDPFDPFRVLEIPNQFGCLMMEQPSFLTCDYGQEYVYSVYNLGKEVLKDKNAIIDLLPSAKKIISHKRMEKINEFIDQGDLFKIFDELTPSEIFYIGYLSIDNQLFSSSNNKIRITEIKEHLEKIGITWKDFEKELADKWGIYEYQAALTNVLLLKPYESCTEYLFELKERLKADFVIQLVLISKEAGIRAKIQPYLTAKTQKFDIENYGRTDDYIDWKTWVDTIKKLDVKSMKKWFDKLIEDGRAQKGESMSPEKRNKIELIYQEYLKKENEIKFPSALGALNFTTPRTDI